MQERATVVVVGAGVAGLTAANRLRQLGIDDVLVVEAAEHVGGRIKQVEGVLPWPVELGPEFVHGAKSSLKVLRWWSNQQHSANAATPDDPGRDWMSPT